MKKEVEKLGLSDDDREHIFHLSGEYGPKLADQVVQTLLVAAGVGRLQYAFRRLENHLTMHLKRVPFEARGLTHNSRGANPTQAILHRLRDELTAPQSVAA